MVAVNKGRLEDLSTRQLVTMAVFSLYLGFTSTGVDNTAMWRSGDRNHPGRHSVPQTKAHLQSRYLGGIMCDSNEQCFLFVFEQSHCVKANGGNDNER